MNRIIVLLALLLCGCGGGGGSSAPASNQSLAAVPSSPPPSADVGAWTGTIGTQPPSTATGAFWRVHITFFTSVTGMTDASGDITRTDGAGSGLYEWSILRGGVDGAQRFDISGVGVGPSTTSTPERFTGTLSVSGGHLVGTVVFDTSQLSYPIDLAPGP